MKSKNIVIFTKTSWNEPPRLRHQLARMLIQYRHNVVFFEKTSLKQIKSLSYTKEKIRFIRHIEIFHHQLKPFNLLVKLNQFFLKRVIKKNLEPIDFDCIINFNYDYDFLKQLFPNKRVITIINDDFVAQAKPWMIKSITHQLQSTCEKSDSVITVSFPLQKQLLQYNQNTTLMFPWSDRKYRYIKREQPFKILIWGYITSRYDFELIKEVAIKFPKYTIDIVGDIHALVKQKLVEITEYTNINYMSSKKLEELKLEDYFLCFAPYSFSKETEAISITNKTFQVLARGLPLINHGMSNFIEKTFIHNCLNYDEVINSIKVCKNNFDMYQKEIELFVNINLAENRYSIIFKKCSI